MLARVLSWTSSSRPAMTLLPIGGRRDQHQKKLPLQQRLARTRRGGRDRRSFLHKLVLKCLDQKGRSIGKVQRKHLVIHESLQKNGQRSLHSSTMVLAGARSSTVLLVAGSGINANTSICAWSVASHTRGMATIERLALSPLAIGSTSVEVSMAQFRARMIIHTHLWM